MANETRTVDTTAMLLELRSAVIDMYAVLQLGVKVSPHIMDQAPDLQARCAGLRKSIEILEKI